MTLLSDSDFKFDGAKTVTENMQKPNRNTATCQFHWSFPFLVTIFVAVPAKMQIP